MPDRLPFDDIEQELVVTAKSNTNGSTYSCLAHTWAEHNYLMLIVNALRAHRANRGGTMTVTGNAEQGRVTVECQCCGTLQFDVEWDSHMVQVA